MVNVILVSQIQGFPIHGLPDCTSYQVPSSYHGYTSCCNIRMARVCGLQVVPHHFEEPYRRSEEYPGFGPVESQLFTVCLIVSGIMDAPPDSFEKGYVWVRMTGKAETIPIYGVKFGQGPAASAVSTKSESKLSI